MIGSVGTLRSLQEPVSTTPRTHELVRGHISRLALARGTAAKQGDDGVSRDLDQPTNPKDRSRPFSCVHQLVGQRATDPEQLRGLR